jgi:hypothetical protein
MKTILRIVGFLVIMAALLVLPELGWGHGFWDWVVSLVGYFLYYELLDFIYKNAPKRDKSTSPS